MIVSIFKEKAWPALALLLVAEPAAGAEISEGALRAGFSEIGLGVAIVLLFGSAIIALRFRGRLRRLTMGVDLIAGSAAELAENDQPCAISAEGEPGLSSLAHSLNAMSARVAVAESAPPIKTPERTTDKRLKVLRETIESLARGRSNTSLITDFVDALRETTGCAHISVWLLHRYLKDSKLTDAAERRLSETQGSSERRTHEILDKVGLLPVHYVSFDAQGEASTGHYLPPVRGILEAAMTTQAVWCPAVEESPLFQDSQHELETRDIRSFLGVPLITQGQLVGVLSLFHTERMPEGEMEFISALAAFLASSVASHYNMHEISKNREMLEVKNLELAMANRRLERTNSSLAEADRQKGDFLASTSHELRTPLNSILGFTQLILNGGCVNEADLKDHVKAIQDGGERLLSLITELLDLAKIDAGKMGINLAPCDVTSAVEAACSLLSVQARQKGYALTYERPQGDVSSIRADFEKIYQVLVNLIGNAIKFTEKESVTVRILTNRFPGFVGVEVVDTGVGIEVKTQAQLFKNFYRGDQAGAAEFGGTGLGLSISRKLVEMQGGAIWISSAGKDCGTTATFAMPLWSEGLEGSYAGGESRSQEADGAATDLKTDEKTVVIIEDHLEVQKYLSELMASLGWSVYTSRTAEKGMYLIQERRPQAIILDMHLPVSKEDAPHKSGLDIITALSREEDMSMVPIYVITGMPKDASDRLLGQTVIMPVEIYSKPLDEKAFRASLERHETAAA